MKYIQLAALAAAFSLNNSVIMADTVITVIRYTPLTEAQKRAAVATLCKPGEENTCECYRLLRAASYALINEKGSKEKNSKEYGYGRALRDFSDEKQRSMPQSCSSAIAIEKGFWGGAKVYVGEYAHSEKELISIDGLVEALDNAADTVESSEDTQK